MVPIAPLVWQPYKTVYLWYASGATGMPIMNGFACWYANGQGFL
jgi:hypothetical protein